MKIAIGEILKAESVGPTERGEIYPKLTGLNRRSFADLLKGFLHYIKLDVNPKDLHLFIQCRNKLVHTGEFYCLAASSAERKKCAPLPTPAEEYYFMVNFLDRIFLRLLSYSGNYVDYRTINNPTRQGEAVCSLPESILLDIDNSNSRRGSLKIFY